MLDFDSNDELHRILQGINSTNGRGSIQAVVPDETCERLLGFNRAGTVVCQLQFGQSSARYTVTLLSNGFTVHFRGRQKSVVSDYFQEEALSAHNL